MIEAGVLFQQAVAALRRDRRASYRLQLGAALGFDEVAALGPYLDALGVSDVYLSPCFRCGPGSSHGYDVTDHNTFNPELGSAAFAEQGRKPPIVLESTGAYEVGGKVIGQTVEMNPTDGIMLWVEEMKPSAPVSNPPKP